MPPSQEDINTLKEMQELINSQDPNISEKFDLRAGVGLAAPQRTFQKECLLYIWKMMMVKNIIIASLIQKSLVIL